MAFVKYNPNPQANRVGDCTVRAIACATKTDWDTAYLSIALQGFVMKDMPSSNAVWGQFLRSIGFVRNVVKEDCEVCYTVRDFAREHPKGTYVVGTGTHVLCIVNGDWHDTWDSADETPIYYFERSDADV
mgnify:CR=1 FL=1